MSDPRDYKVDISGVAPPSPASRGALARPFVSVLFGCCNVYQRVYRSADGTRYDGRCPRCGRGVRFRVGAGGTSERFFVVE
jgi:hypothetical protein